MGYPIREVITIKGTWDYAVDGGAVGVYPLVSVPANFRVKEVFYEVATAITSGGTPALTVGDGNDDDGYITNFNATKGVTGVKASGEGTRGALIWDDTNDANLNPIYTSADTIDFKVATAALTAGKLYLYVRGERLS